MLTFGLGRRDSADRVAVEWPSGATQEFRNLRAGRYELTEGQNVGQALPPANRTR
jgi:hypothetical protein